MPPRISVIVPIYNAASTLRAAVQSILTQDIAGLEVLLVDDGSTDATPGLCHDLALRDDRIQVITQKNAGICAARNRGLSVAEGMYVTFCDDDDLLLPGALALLLQKAEDTGADIVRADYELIHISPDGTETPQPHPAGTACDLAADSDYRKFLQNSGPQFVWNALYRRSAIGNLRFDEHCRYGLEDFIFNAGLMPAPTKYTTCRSLSTAISRVGKAPPSARPYRLCRGASACWTAGWQPSIRPFRPAAPKLPARPSGTTAAPRLSPF